MQSRRNSVVWCCALEYPILTVTNRRLSLTAVIALHFDDVLSSGVPVDGGLLTRALMRNSRITITVIPAQFPAPEEAGSVLAILFCKGPVNRIKEIFHQRSFECLC
jgi:hypothetical protein